MDMQVKKHSFRVLDHSGDTKTVWDRSNADEVAHARKSFNDLTAKGFAAFSVNPDGKKGERIREFNPDIEAMILAPAIVGG